MMIVLGILAMFAVGYSSGLERSLRLTGPASEQAAVLTGQCVEALSLASYAVIAADGSVKLRLTDLVGP